MKKEPICGIYKITCIVTGKIYIGQSVDCMKRAYAYSTMHRYEYGKKQRHLYNSIKKYGWENHTFEIIHECAKEELNLWERHFVKLLNSFGSELGMNLTDGGDAPTNVSEETKKRISESIKGEKNGFYGRHHSDDTKEFLRKLHRGNKYALGSIRSQETKDKLRSAHLGKIASEKTKSKMRESHRGKKHDWNKGNIGKFKHSEEHKQRLREMHKGKCFRGPGYKHTEETKSKIAKSNTGKKLSDEAKRKISIGNKGRKHTEATLARMSKSHMGIPSWNKGLKGAYKHSEETLARMRGRKHTKEEIEKQRAKTKGVPKSEEHKKKLSEAGKKYYQNRKNEG